MEKIDKCINGLEHCTGKNGCFECQYSCDGFSATVGCKLQVDKDALETIKECKENLRIMFNRCHTLIHTCDVCIISKTCKQLRSIDK